MNRSKPIRDAGSSLKPSPRSALKARADASYCLYDQVPGQNPILGNIPDSRDPVRGNRNKWLHLVRNTFGNINFSASARGL